MIRVWVVFFVFCCGLLKAQSVFVPYSGRPVAASSCSDGSVTVTNVKDNGQMEIVRLTRYSPPEVLVNGAELPPGYKLPVYGQVDFQQLAETPCDEKQMLFFLYFGSNNMPILARKVYGVRTVDPLLSPTQAISYPRKGVMITEVWDNFIGVQLNAGRLLVNGYVYKDGKQQLRRVDFDVVRKNHRLLMDMSDVPLNTNLMTEGCVTKGYFWVPMTLQDGSAVLLRASDTDHIQVVKSGFFVPQWDNKIKSTAVACGDTSVVLAYEERGTYKFSTFYDSGAAEIITAPVSVGGISMVKNYGHVLKGSDLAFIMNDSMFMLGLGSSTKGLRVAKASTAAPLGAVRKILPSGQELFLLQEEAGGFSRKSLYVQLNPQLSSNKVEGKAGSTVLLAAKDFGYAGFASPTVSIDGTTVTSTVSAEGISFTVPQNATAGDHAITIEFAGTKYPATLTIAAAPLPPRPTVTSIEHGGTFLPNPVAPGTWMVIRGVNLGRRAEDKGIPLTLGGVQVRICGQDARIMFNSGPEGSSGRPLSWQLNVLIPENAPVGECWIETIVDGVSAAPVKIFLVENALDAFVFVGYNTPYPPIPLPVVTHADLSLVGPVAYGYKPVLEGEEVTLWGTGCAGKVVTEQITLTVSGKPAKVTYAGPSGDLTPGQCQVNFVVPEGLPWGPNELRLSSGGGPHPFWKE